MSVSFCITMLTIMYEKKRVLVSLPITISLSFSVTMFESLSATVIVSESVSYKYV